MKMWVHTPLSLCVRAGLLCGLPVRWKRNHCGMFRKYRFSSANVSPSLPLPRSLHLCLLLPFSLLICLLLSPQLEHLLLDFVAVDPVQRLFPFGVERTSVSDGVCPSIPYWV